MNQVTFSADKENLLFIVGDQMIKYPLREGVVISFVEGQPVVAKPGTGTEPAPQFQTSLAEGNKVVDLVLDSANEKGYLVGDLEVVIGFQEPKGLAPEAEKEINGTVHSFNFDTKASKVFIVRKGDDLSITLLSLTSTEINE